MEDRTLTVGELGDLVRVTLDAALPYGVWVEGEIRGIKRSRNGHVYFDLVEAAEEAGAPPVAAMPVVLFRDARDRVNKLLKRHGNPIRMEDGVRIRIQGALDFYAPQGRIQLRMTAIDPTFTLGLLAADRDALLAALAAEGVLRANAAVPIPPVPLRVGVVTSLGSAAHADLTTVFERSGHGFTLLEADSAVQGRDAPAAIAAAITSVDAAGVDVIVVARGGGAKIDLAAFDHELVARAIIGASTPVVTGIGHDIDRAVADEVAHTATTTPTAAAQFVVARVDAWLERLGEIEQATARAGLRALGRADHRLDLAHRRLVTGAHRTVGRAAERLAARSQRLAGTARRADARADAQVRFHTARLATASRHALRRADERLTVLDARIRAVDPAVALARGWSITRDADGRVIRSVRDLAPGAVVTTRVADGTATSTIIETTEDTA